MKFFNLFLHKPHFVGVFIEFAKKLRVIQHIMQFFSLFNGARSHEYRFARAIKTGSIILLLFFGTFGLWAVFAPIESFVRGQGNIIYEERGQIVQHLEGGVIEQIYVKEGDSVGEGQALLLLKTPVAYSNHAMLNNQICIAQLTIHRLNAELNGQGELFFGSTDTECAESLLGQQQLMFAARKSDLEQRILLIKSHIELLKKEIEAIEVQKKANSIQWALNKEELATAQQLFEKNIIHKDQLVALKQKNAELEGRDGYYEASISKVEQQIAEDHIKISNVKNNFLYDAARELKEVSANLLTLQEKHLVNTDIIERSIVRSPKKGVIKSLKHHTLGGIIAPGSAILEVVPVQSDLIIEAKISNKDVAALLMINKDILNPNVLNVTPVKVKTRIITYSSRVVPLIEGEMYNVSADAFLDGRGIVGYYGVYVRLPAESIAMLGAVKAYPGMPVEVYIPTTSRTLFSYLLKPIVLSFDKAFRET